MFQPQAIQIPSDGLGLLLCREVSLVAAVHHGYVSSVLRKEDGLRASHIHVAVIFSETFKCRFFAKR